MKCKLPSLNYKKVKQMTTTESGPRTSRLATQQRKQMIRQIFNEILKQDDCTPERWRIRHIKVIHTKVMWKKLVTTARCVLCQRYTNCSQQSYTTDFTADSTKRDPKTKEGLNVLTKCWTILQHTDCWSRNFMSRNQNAGRDSRLHEGI